jgi:hypothetical protein
MLNRYLFVSCKQCNNKGENKLKEFRTCTIGIFLVLIFAASVITTIPTTYAQEARTQKTYPLIDAIPNPVGVGQQVLIRHGISEGLGMVLQGWEDITVTIVDPDKITTSLGPLRTDSTGAGFTSFTPNKVGTYVLTTNFPEQEVPQPGWFVAERGAFLPGGTVMLASSISTELVVQQEPLEAYQDLPLPVEYWTRPIDPQLRSWYQIAGNWVERPPNSFSPYNDDAPETAHVLWAKQLTTGGLTGGLWETDIPASSETGDAYEGKFQNSVIINGILYYNVHAAGFGGPNETPGVRANDLHTGKELWFRNDTSINFGQILYFNSFNYDGVFTYLWTVSGSTWRAMDPFTGEWAYSMTNVPNGVQVRGPSGEFLRYVIDYNAGWMALWNSTDAGLTLATGFSGGSWGNVVSKRSVNASVPGAYSWNVSIPTGLTAQASFGVPTLRVYPDRIVAVDYNQTRVRVWGISLNPSTRGTTLFDRTTNAPAEWSEGSNTLHYVGASDHAEGGIIAVWSKELRKHYGFSTEDGTFKWETDSEHWLDWYGWGNVEHTWYFAYDKLYSVGVAGIVYAYDMKTGDTMWTYEMTGRPTGEPITGGNWWGWITNIADGKVYVSTVEHSAEQPLPRGGPFIALNATDGTEIFRVNGMFRATRWGGNAVMGDSIIATMDTYDQRIYAVGKGPSKTTVSTNPGVLQLNNGVIIQGFVTDISPGTESDEMKLRFANGVPAVSDENQSQWMLYVYKQFPRPKDATGVTVSLDVLDANGNYRNIGTTTADASGFFSFNWTPDIEGKYTVFATFDGSKAYYGSYAQTAFAVSEAAATPTPTGTTGTSIVDQFFIPAVAAIILAIIIVGAVLFLALRKRP